MRYQELGTVVREMEQSEVQTERDTQQTGIDEMKQTLQVCDRLRDVVHTCDSCMESLGSSTRGEMSASVRTLEMGVAAMRQRTKRAHDFFNCIKDVYFESNCPKSTQMTQLLLSKHRHKMPGSFLEQCWSEKPSNCRSECLS